MSLIVDDIVVCPKETVPGGVESSLSANGLSIVGADFGETKAKGTAVQTNKGIVLVNREPETRTVTLKLEVRPAAETTLPEAAAYLQQIVGVLQSTDEWFRRDHHVGGDFGSLLYHVTGEVSLADFAGWQAGESPDVTLSMVCDFAAYSTEEHQEGPFTSVGGERHLIFTEKPSTGSVNGLWRCRVTNEGEEDLRGLILSRECRYAPDDLDDPAAQLHYPAKDLTPKGGSEVKMVDGKEVLVHSALPPHWSMILSSEILAAEAGHMAHRGPRRAWMWVNQPSGAARDVQLQLQARSLGAARWDTLLPIVSVPVVGGWIPVDLGLVRPQADGLWEWRLMARSQGEATTVRVDSVYLLSTEQYGLTVSRPVAEPGVADLVVYDQFTHVAAPLTGNSLTSGEIWDGEGDSNDFSSDGEGQALRSATLDASTVAGPRFVYPSTLTFADVDVKVTVSWDASPAVDGSLGLGVFARRVDPKNMFGVELLPLTDKTVVGVVKKVVGGVVSELAVSAPSPPIPGFGFQIIVRLVIDGQGNWQAIFTGVPGLAGTLILWGSDDDLAAGGALGNGKAGIFDHYWGSSPVTRTYRDFYLESDGVTFSAPVAHAGRGIEIASDGVRRQHASEDDVWGNLVLDGFNPYVTPGGLVGRPTRTIVIATAGDLANISDGTAAPSLSAVPYRRDGHHFARDVSSS